MADLPAFKRGSTWPPLRGSALGSDGDLLPLPDAQSIRAVMRSGATVVDGTAEVLDPPEPDPDDPDGPGFNWRYVWRSDGTDTNVAGVYQTELEITWGSGRVQRVPGRRGPSFEITNRLD